MKPPRTTPDLDVLVAKHRGRHPDATLVEQPFTLDTPWDTNTARRQLVAVYEFRADHVRGFVSEHAPDASRSHAGLDARADECRAAIIDFDAPLRLASVEIAKPWGREIWYTGVEARGVAGITDGLHVTPLPWALHSHRQHCKVRNRSPC
ncbi:MAG: hypothetical protein HC809_04770 [Gammaproteobacteria bacterium]|nr:hypothetical protein [Gammaproteobacteria bacterium]